MNVDLPQPDGPITAVTLRSTSGSEISRSACLSPNHAESLSASIFAPASALSTMRALRIRMLSTESLKASPGSFSPRSRRASTPSTTTIATSTSAAAQACACQSSFGVIVYVKICTWRVDVGSRRLSL